MNTENAFDVNHEQVYPNGGEFPEDTSSNANVDANTTNGTETNTAIERTAVTTTASSSIDVDMKNTLPDDNIEDRKKKDKPEVVSFTSLFRFAKAIDIFYMLIGTIAALANGGGFPLMLLLFGNMTDVFTNRSFDLCTFNFTALDQFCPPGVKLTAQNFLNEYKKCNFSGSNFTIPENDFSTKIREQAVWFVIIGGATMIIGYFQVAFWSMACERQTRRLREVLFRAILNKEISYFDINKTGELNTRLTEDVNKVHDGIGDKISSALQFFSTFIGGMALGFIKGWKLTLVVLSVSPVLFGGAVILTRIIATTTSKELKSYAKAGAVAEEVFSSIRTVFAYNGATYESDRYKQHLRTVKINGIRKGATTGAFLGFLFLIIFCAYALGFWYGAKLVRDEKYSIGDILTIFFSIITAVFSLGQAAPHLQAMAQARGAAYTLWFIIDTPSKITSDSESGIKADDLIGDIQFTNVNFVYPSRPDVSVLNGLSFTAQQGETIALVGTSGCGKSTCMQLLQRFYDPISGSVMIGDHRVDEYHLGWLRQRIGVVSQEPILFQATIAENILLGRPEATQQEIEDAARIANAHDFIMTLPQKYDTPVGERGAQMSGGQKQRIAIARALIRDPRILLLDEATSALDTESERIVQDALNTASKGRTTIVIAHRLSTIVNASKIIVIDKGTVIEEGNHHSLMELKGNYYGLVEAQNLRMNKTDETELENENEDDLIVDKQDNRTSSLDEDARHAAATTFEERPDGQAEVQDDKNVKGSGRSPFFTMLRMNKPEWCYIMFGCIACICNGVQPAFGLILSKVIAVFQECDLHEREKRVNFYVILFAGFGVLMLITMFLQTFLFTISGEALTQRLRTKIFRLLLRQEVAYFDKPENSTGALCTRLSTEASAVQGATGIRIGTMLQNFANLGVGIVLAFFYGWQLTLVVLAFVPFMIISGFLQTYLLTGFANKDKKALEEAGKIAIESISNIRTVAQLVKEPYFGDEYCKLLDVPLRNSLRRAHIFAILFSFTNSIMFYAQAALFIFGGWMVDRGSMTFENVMLVLNCLLFGAMAVGQTASLSPDYAKAIDASKRILALFDRTPEIDNGATDGDVLENFKGEIDFVDLQFRYPNRAELSVLKRFNLNIKPHQQVALVGASGCGKSTTIQLIERFYNPTNGQLLVDHHDVSTLNLQWWRSKIGFVSQEPVLFDASIRENIAYGDTSRYVPMAEICEAAKNANIHRFIETLPEQYETNVGAKGTQLSGGEKQRIAIARALIRNPSILLLDEATSALDTESERIVQDALDRASKGRTTIVIAHRLSTIQNSDVICVIHRGRIVEQGVHDDLLAKKGFYYRLAQAKK